MVFRAQVWLALGFAAQLVSAQLLPSCAQDCVGTTRTKCDATDFHCACTDSKYISKLSKCVENFCEPKEKEQAFLYLTQLCSSVGVTLEKGRTQVEHIEVRLAVPRGHLEARQSFDDFFSFTDETTSTEPPTSARDTATGAAATKSSPATNSATTTSSAGGDNNEFSGGGGSSKKKSSFSVGAKVGVGVAIPIILGLLAGVVVLIRWMKAKKVPQHTPESGGAVGGPEAQAGQPGPGPQGPHGQPQMVQAPMVQGQPHMAPAPAELSQSAMYIGHEMETKGGNTTEMPASPVPGYVQPQSQGQTPPPGYTQPVPLQQQQVQSPPIPQPYGAQSPPVPAAYTPVQQQPQQQWTPPPQAQPVPQQQQWSSPPPQPPPQGQWVFVPSPSAEQPGQGQPYYPPQQPQYTQPAQPTPPPQELPDRK